MKKSIMAVVMVTSLTLILAGCSAAVKPEKEVLAKNAAKNFELIVENNLENKVYHDQLKHFGLALGNQDKFEWAQDTSVGEADFSLSINANEFIQAGMDPAKLVSNEFEFVQGGETEQLVHTFDVSDDESLYEDYKLAFEGLLSRVPDQIKTIKNDGYILDLGQSFQVHWNGENRKNKDIAFIINGDSLIKAGLDLEKLTSWKVIKNTDEGDKTVRLLRVYRLR